MLQQSLRESRETSDRMFAMIGVIEARLVALEEAAAEVTLFRDELFEWLEGYSQWEAHELNVLRTHMSELYRLFVPGAVPESAPPATATPPAERTRRFA